MNTQDRDKEIEEALRKSVEEAWDADISTDYEEEEESNNKLYSSSEDVEMSRKDLLPMHLKISGYVETAKLCVLLESIDNLDLAYCAVHEGRIYFFESRDDAERYFGES